ncbi:hypothetical protein Taro_054592 [Colocasia esculenta]|uniref:Uncharacterized protein n=1 Tax=Colocasia esculenta TaxID=4460 RepID=A0A843XR25_COLES|nr:hypothetical protein [Colocasia esculenta]
MVVPKKGTSMLLAHPCRVALRCEQLVARFPAGFKCELQESVAAIAGCACYEHGCWFARAAVEFVVGLRIHVGVSRRLREPTCGVAFTGAGLWSVEPVEGVLASLAVPLLLGLRCAVHLAGVFWRVFPKRCLGGSGGGSPRTYLHCFCSSTCCSVFSDGPCCWPFGLCVLVKVLPRIAPLLILAEVLPRSVWCSFWATVVLPLWFEVCRLVGLRSGEVLLGRLLALLVESRCGAFDRVSGRGAGQFLDCAGGTSCVPMFGWFASLLVPYVLSQMVV